MNKAAEIDGLICVHCLEQGTEIFEVNYTERDGVYQFLCKSTNHTVEDGFPIHAAHVFEENEDIEFFSRVKRNFSAQRLRAPSGWEMRFVDIDELPDAEDN